MIGLKRSGIGRDGKQEKTIARPADATLSSENKFDSSYLKNERGVNGECHFSVPLSCFNIFFKIVQNGLPTVTLHFNRITIFASNAL